MRLPLLIAVWSVLFYCSQALSADPSVKVAITSAVDAASTFSKDEYCELQIEISNESWGTLHYLWLSLRVWDDRDQEVRGYGFGDIVQNAVGHDKVAVPIGTSILVNKAKFSSKCRWLSRVSATLGNDDCAIRMMPEAAKCSETIQLISYLPTLSVDRVIDAD